MERLTIFVHYNKENLVDDYVYFYLKELLNVSTTLVFSTSSVIDEDSSFRLAKMGVKIFLRENVGYDFGGWKDVILSDVVDLADYDQLVLANDSCYGPLFSLKEVFEDIKFSDVDFWGITDYYIFRRYLQSYFLVYNKNVFLSNVFQKFWDDFPLFDTKHDAVLMCEEGLHRNLVNSGFAYSSYLEISMVSRLLYSFLFKCMVIRAFFTSKRRSFEKGKYTSFSSGRKLSYSKKVRMVTSKMFRLLGPLRVYFMLYFPLFLINRKCPFIKKMLFDKNPAMVDLDKIFCLLKLKSDYPISLISRRK